MSTVYMPSGIPDFVTKRRPRMYQTISKGIITSYVVGMFLAVWLGYYNLFAFRSGRFAGGIISVAAYNVSFSVPEEINS